MSLQTKAIESFCKTGSGSTPSRKKQSRYYGGDIPWVKSGELEQGLVIDTEESITQAALDETSVKLIPSGALLVAMYGATVGKVAQLGISATSNQAVCHIIPDTNVADTKYLFYALRQQVPFWLSRRVGGAQPNISQQIIKSTKITLPPIEEQRRIAAIADQADAIRRKRKEAIRLTESLLRSAFLDMFGDRVTNPKGWEKARIGEISKIQGDLQVSRKRDSLPPEVPYLRVANVFRDKLLLEEIKTIRVTENEIERTKLKNGDILVVEGHGNSKEIGRSSVWDESIPNCTHQNHLIRVRVNPDRVTARYLSAFINSPGGKRQLQRFGKTTSGLNTISTSNVKSVEIPLPPLERQREYLRFQQQCASRLNAYQEELSVLERLFSSFLQRAFRGEL